MANNALFEPAAGTPAAWPDNRLLAAPPSMADAYEHHAQALQQWMAEQRASGVAAGSNDPETGWPTRQGLVDAIGQAAQGVLLGTTAPGKMPSRLVDFAHIKTANGDALTAHVNPSGLDLARMFEKSPNHILRVLREGPNHAIWPAYDATHAEMAAPLGFTKDAERLKFFGKPGPPDDLHPHKAGRFSFDAVDQQELPPIDFHDQN